MIWKTDNVLVYIFFFLVTVIFTRTSYAVTTPTFPTCANPQGVLKVSYSTGSHGIVGVNTEQKGSDSVYTLSDGTLMQCFCSDDGSGIQTNWWKVSLLTDAQIKVLKIQGWFYVPNGALWGLSEAPYMAYNSSYSCRGIGGGTGGGEILAASTQLPVVLGLAGTGTTRMILGFTLGGIILLILARMLHIHGQRH